MDSYKYLGTMLDLSFQINAETICKKVQQRLYFLRKINLFKVSTKKMTLFYKSFIESVLTFSITVWFGNLSLTERNKLGRLVSVAGKVIGVNQSPLHDLFVRNVMRKALSILDCVDHHIYGEFVLLPSGRRNRVPIHRTKRYQLSFICATINMLNLVK